MDTSIIIYKKTAKGDEEISARTFGLSANLRRVLILVDGSATAQKIVEKGEGLTDVLQSLKELEKQGYISPIEGNLIARLKEELIAMARRILGEDAENVVRKLKEAPDTREGIEATISSCKKFVKLVIDEKKADELMNQCADIVARYK